MERYDPIKHFDLLNDKDLIVDELHVLAAKLESSEYRKQRRAILKQYKELMNKYLKLLDLIDSL